MVSVGIWQWTMQCSFDITHSSERLPILQRTTIVEPGLQRVAAALFIEAASRDSRQTHGCAGRRVTAPSQDRLVQTGRANCQAMTRYIKRA
jgi:hypothetical protein